MGSRRTSGMRLYKGFLAPTDDTEPWIVLVVAPNARRAKVLAARAMGDLMIRDDWSYTDLRVRHLPAAQVPADAAEGYHTDELGPKGGPKTPDWVSVWWRCGEPE